MSHPFRSRCRRSYHLRRHRVRLPSALTDPLRGSLGGLTGPTSFVIRGTGGTAPVCSRCVAFAMFAIFPGVGVPIVVLTATGLVISPRWFVRSHPKGLGLLNEQYHVHYVCVLSLWSVGWSHTSRGCCLSARARNTVGERLLRAQLSDTIVRYTS